MGSIGTANSCAEGIIRLAKKAVCVYLFMGLESFSETGLQHANKIFKRVDHYGETIKRLHRHGISVQAGIIFGFDSDTIDTFDSTLEFCESIGIDGVTPSILTPFPGTGLYNQFKKEGRLLPVDWSYYNSKTRVSFQPKHLTPEELLIGYHTFRGKFYSLKSIIKRLWNSKVNIFYNLLMNYGYRQAYGKHILKDE